MTVLARVFERALAVGNRSPTPPVDAFKTWTRMRGGKWTCIAFGSHEACYAELSRRIDGSVTAVVLPAGQEPLDDDPTPPPAALAAATCPTGLYEWQPAAPTTCSDRTRQETYDRQALPREEHQRRHHLNAVAFAAHLPARAGAGHPSAWAGVKRQHRAA